MKYAPPFEDIDSKSEGEIVELNDERMLTFEMVLEQTERAKTAGVPVVLEIVTMSGQTSQLEVRVIPQVDEERKQNLVIGYVLDDGRMTAQALAVVYGRNRPDVAYPVSQKLWLLPNSRRDEPVYRRPLNYQELVELVVDECLRTRQEPERVSLGIAMTARNMLLLSDVQGLNADLRMKALYGFTLSPHSDWGIGLLARGMAESAHQEERWRDRFLGRL